MRTVPPGAITSADGTSRRLRGVAAHGGRELTRARGAVRVRRSRERVEHAEDVVEVDRDRVGDLARVLIGALRRALREDPLEPVEDADDVEHVDVVDVVGVPPHPRRRRSRSDRRSRRDFGLNRVGRRRHDRPVADVNRSPLSRRLEDRRGRQRSVGVDVLRQAAQPRRAHTEGHRGQAGGRRHREPPRPGGRHGDRAGRVLARIGGFVAGIDAARHAVVAVDRGPGLARPAAADLVPVAEQAVAARQTCCSRGRTRWTCCSCRSCTRSRRRSWEPVRRRKSRPRRRRSSCTRFRRCRRSCCSRAAAGRRHAGIRRADVAVVAVRGRSRLAHVRSRRSRPRCTRCCRCNPDPSRSPPEGGDVRHRERRSQRHGRELRRVHLSAVVAWPAGRPSRSCF